MSGTGGGFGWRCWWWVECECDGGTLRGVCEEREGCEELPFMFDDIIGIDVCDIEPLSPEGRGMSFLGSVSRRYSCSKHSFVVSRLSGS